MYLTRFLEKREYILTYMYLTVVSFFLALVSIYETSGIFRSYLTDVFSAMYVFFFLRIFLFQHRKMFFLSVVTIFLLIEFNQLGRWFSSENSFLQEVFIGGTFDPYDFIFFYGLGALCSLTFEKVMKIKQVSI